MKKIKLTTFLSQAESVFFQHPQIFSVRCRVDIQTDRKGDQLVKDVTPTYQISVFFFIDDPKKEDRWNTYGDGNTPEIAIYNTKIAVNKDIPGAFDIRQEVETETP